MTTPPRPPAARRARPGLFLALLLVMIGAFAYLAVGLPGLPGTHPLTGVVRYAVHLDGAPANCRADVTVLRGDGQTLQFQGVADGWSTTTDATFDAKLFATALARCKGGVTVTIERNGDLIRENRASGDQPQAIASTGE